MAKKLRIGKTKLDMVDTILTMRIKNFVKKYPFVLDYCDFDDIKQDIYTYRLIPLLKKSKPRKYSYFKKLINTAITLELKKVLKKVSKYLNTFEITNMPKKDYPKDVSDIIFFDDLFNKKVCQKNAKILDLYLNKGYNFKKIANRYHISKQRVTQIFKEILKKMQKNT